MREKIFHGLFHQSLALYIDAKSVVQDLLPVATYPLLARYIILEMVTILDTIWDFWNSFLPYIWQLIYCGDIYMFTYLNIYNEIQIHRKFEWLGIVVNDELNIFLEKFELSRIHIFVCNHRAIFHHHISTSMYVEWELMGWNTGI